MEISRQDKDVFKLKTKTGSVLMAGAEITMSHKSGGEDFVISQSGEYEVEGISVFGYQSDEHQVYVTQVEDLRVLYLGNLAKPLSEEAVAELENIDVVIVSTDGLPSKALSEMVERFEPYYVLPYGSKVSEFFSAYEHSSRSVKSLSLSKLSLSEDLTEVIVFE